MNQTLLISVAKQRLYHYRDHELHHEYIISTAKNGVGEQQGSEKTPSGQHEICAKIGRDSPINTVFVGRVPTGEIYTESLGQQFPERDWILTRILWLSGLEIGKNCHGEVDTKQRYIYIHGCPDSFSLGQADSHGCIRMRNSDIIQLYNQVEVGTPVDIEA